MKNNMENNYIGQKVLVRGIALTERDYGGATVKKLWRYYGGGKDNANTELHNQG